MKIVVTGRAGFDGSKRIYEDEKTRKKLLERYSESFFGVFEDHDTRPVKDISVLRFGKSLEKALSDGTAENGADGGVLAALWRLLHRNHMGAEFSLRSIPMIQQTVEICESTGRDPYRLGAGEVNVWITADDDALLREAEEAGICAAVIGFTVPGPAIVRNDGVVRAFLRRPEEEK